MKSNKMKKAMKKKILEICKKSKVSFGEALSKHTTFRIGGLAEAFIYCEDIEELKRIIAFFKKVGLSYCVIGNGSNLLVSDKGIKGCVVKLGNIFSEVAFNKERIIVGSACSLQKLIFSAAEKGLSGIESLSGIPGTVGGAVIANAGAWGNSIGNHVISIKVLTEYGKLMVMKKNDLKFSYRESILKKKNRKAIIIEIELGNFKKESPKTVKEKIKSVSVLRKTTQPFGQPSPGCIFKNPRQAAAGMLIDFAGIKRTKIGRAQVSEKHANFIVNNSRAKAIDVIKLIEYIRKEIKKNFGINLELEIEKWGF